MAGEAVGFLELGLDRVDAAIDRLERVAVLSCAGSRRRLQRPRGQATSPRRTCGAATTGPLERALARLTNASSGVTPGLERSAAMLAGDHAYELLFMRSLAWSARAQQPFEFARTQLCFGERLHRAGRLQEAAARVSAALDSFSSLGRAPLGRARPSAPGPDGVS